MKSNIYNPGSKRIAYRRTVTGAMRLSDGRIVGKITVDYNTLYVCKNKNGSDNWTIADCFTLIARQKEGRKRMIERETIARFHCLEQLRRDMSRRDDEV